MGVFLGDPPFTFLNIKFDNEHVVRGSITGWLRYHFAVFQRLGIPGPEPTLVLGNIREILSKGSFQALLDWHGQYGDAFGYFEGHTPVVVVSDADVIKQVLVKDFFDYFPNRKPYPMAPRKTHALFLARGGKWKRIRNILSPAFSSARMKQMSPIINKAVSEMIDNMEKPATTGEPYDIFEAFQRLTLDVIGRSALGLNFTCQKDPDDPYLRNIRFLFQGLAKSKLLPFLMVMPFLCHLLVGVKNLVTLIGLNPVRFLIQGMTEVIQERRSRPTSTGYVDLIELMLHSEVASASDTKAFVHPKHIHATKTRETISTSMVEDVANANKKTVDCSPNDSGIPAFNKPFHCQGLTEEEIISQSIVFLLAGYETTSTTLAFAAYALVTNPHIQELVCREIDQNITADTEVSYETVQNLRYLDMFFCEVCRMYPTAGLVCTRQAVKDWSYRHLRVPAGMAVQVHVWAVHHDAKYWPQPDLFDPDRFSPERRGNIKPFCYLPFGEGPRNCIGMRFAVMEAKIALVRILQKYTLHRCSQTQVPVQFESQGAVNPKQGVVITLESRSPLPHGISTEQRDTKFPFNPS
ncbi:cytochrome P450 3A8-like [Liolophura sinensis]|uniref:cytochrome P450 3A8-like n=1 Tax=Liolophura sinensis TaxID=3198878 RepID=UPI003158BCEE